MAERRMLSLHVIDSDEFLEMPSDVQLLYFHLCLRADDDGFITPRKVMKMIGAKDDALRILLAKDFLIPFDSGVIVIKHWRLHNLIRKDRYSPTIFREEADKLYLDTTKAYTLDDTGVPFIEADDESGNQVATSGLPNGNQRLTQVRLGKDSIGEIEESNSLHSLSSSCPETEAEQAQNEEIFIEMPLLGNKSVGIPTSYVEKMQSLYQAVDVKSEIRRAVAWIINNPKNRKSDWRRFIGNWLSKEQDKAGRISSYRRTPATRTDYDGRYAEDRVKEAEL